MPSATQEKTAIINTLVFEIHTEVFDEYGDELPVNRRFTANRISRILTMTNFDGDGGFSDEDMPEGEICWRVQIEYAKDAPLV